MTIPVPCGRPAHMTPYQEKLLVVLHERPWTKEFVLQKSIDADHCRWNLHDCLKRLESKDLARRVVGPNRAVLWGPADVPPPEHMMILAKGAPSLYHAARLPQRVLDILTQEPWLTIRMICLRIGSVASHKAVEQAVRGLLVQGRVQRRLVDTAARQFYCYAISGPKRLSTQQRRRLEAEVLGVYGYGEGAMKVLKVLAKHPWITAMEISEKAEIRPGYVYNVLHSTQARDKVKRLRILDPGVASGRGVVFKYALVGAAPPLQEVAPEPTAGEDALARMATIVEESPGVSSTEAWHKYQERYRQISKERAFYVLTKLESLGVISNLRKCQTGRISWRKVWQSNGKAAELMASRARVHVDLIERHARKLRALGYAVKLEVSPPEVPP